MNKAAPLLCALVLLGTGMPVAAELYRWVDAQGRVHYGQTPPKHGTFERVRGAAPPGSAPNLETMQQDTQKLETQQRERREATTKAEEIEAQRRQACNAARQRLAFLDSSGGRRLFKQDAEGKRSFMPEEEVQAERRAVETRILQTCGTAP